MRKLTQPQSRPSDAFRVRETPRFYGRQTVYRFPNGYGASVAFDERGELHIGDHRGKYELAVVRWKADDYEIAYDTPITSDVEAWLDWPDVEALLERIGGLPAHG